MNHFLELTDVNGRRLLVNVTHIVQIDEQDTGARLLAPSGQTANVSESYDAIRAALVVTRLGAGSEEGQE